jgi:NADPH-dependent 2,4-dienoyl-CoA reductase/sulfur reductase-like enzyme
LATAVVIIGGELVGLELAEFLQERGREVTVIEPAPRLGKGLTLVRRMRILSELAEHGVALCGGAQAIAITPDAVRFTDQSGEARSVRANTVIVAMGAAGDLSLAEALRAAGHAVTAIGDAGGVGYIEGAMRGAYEAMQALVG